MSGLNQISDAIKIVVVSDPDLIMGTGGDAAKSLQEQSH